LQLRLDYTNLELLSPLAKQIEMMQKDCSITKHGIFRQRNLAGLGSDLHMYSTGLCKALQMNDVRLRSIGVWIYRDEQQCHNMSDFESPMSCYFPQSELECPNDNDNINGTTTKIAFTRTDGEIPNDACSEFTASIDGGTSTIRAATTEYLFTRVSNIVQDEGERQLKKIFTNNRKTNYNIPKNLITVHIRWGDKDMEMQLPTIYEYTSAIQKILDRRKSTKQEQNLSSAISDVVVNTSHNDNEDVHILLATEDPEAVDQFMQAKPEHWNVYIDQYYVEMLSHRLKVGNVFNANLFSARSSKGRSGLIALGSLLVAMEANDFVLTTASNWSRLINEIRKNIINPRCNNCTTMIDIREGEF
jgi:phenylpyruvate tautomerase PptA (4-oxalocrotonate tautomerase family)